MTEFTKESILLQPKLADYARWLKVGKDLNKLYFDFTSLYSDRKIFIHTMYESPKTFFDNEFKIKFLEIDIVADLTELDEPIEKLDRPEKIYIGVEGKYEGKVYFYHWIDFNEYYTKDKDGNEVEYMQDDAYTYNVIANSFDEFENSKLFLYFLEEVLIKIS